MWFSVFTIFLEFYKRFNFCIFIYLFLYITNAKRLYYEPITAYYYLFIKRNKINTCKI